ncbi:hypothetical protein GCM10018779_66730 [Streptomyces griseocarneus]|nr:hypothetical protein GCM10018779_66730 [Streptomyces griseocarneus]
MKNWKILRDCSLKGDGVYCVPVTTPGAVHATLGAMHDADRGQPSDGREEVRERYRFGTWPDFAFEVAYDADGPGYRVGLSEPGTHPGRFWLASQPCGHRVHARLLLENVARSPRL